MSAAFVITMLALFVAGVLLNAFFAGYETGFVSSNPVRVRRLAETEGQPNARRLQYFRDNPDRLLSIVLVGTNITLVMGTIAITRLVGAYWAMAIATPIFLIFGEIIPKSVFRAHPTRLSLALMPGVRIFSVILWPLIFPTYWLSRAILLLTGSDRQAVEPLMRTPEDMRVLVDESADRGAIEPEEKAMIHSVMDLSTRYVKEVMVPRIDIQALPETATRAELIALFNESGRTRIPIYLGSIDAVTGLVNTFDVLRDTEPDNQRIDRFIKPTIHVHDTMRLDDVLKTMRDERQSMAIITDEYGGTDGLVTLEDILEEIFGEIRDEYDDESAAVRQIAPNDYAVDARTPLEELAEAIGVAIEDEEVETVGGWLMRIAGRIPQKGDTVVSGRFRVRVLDGGPNHVSTVRLEVLGETVDGE